MLSLDDIAGFIETSAKTTDPAAVWAEADRIIAATIGYKLLTAFRYVEANTQVERIYSSDPATYPVGGRKAIVEYPVNQAALARGETFLAADEAAVRSTYADWPRILSLGIGSILNVAIRHGGRNLGAINISHEAGWFGPGRVRDARIIAGLLVPCVLAQPD